MSLRKRLSLVAAVAVGVAVALAVLVSYIVVRKQLRDQVDSALRAQAVLVHDRGNVGLESALPGLPATDGGRAPFAQMVTATGQVVYQSGGMPLPVDATTRAVASGKQSGEMEDVSVGGADLRVYTFHDVAFDPAPVPVAVQLARPLSSVNHVLSRLRVILALLLLGGIAVAAVLSRMVARRVLVPLAEVTSAAQHIGATDDLSRRIVVHHEDEVGTLARRFNEMLERLERSRRALDASVRAQRQLVADASHELRTPVTSLRTNIEVLLEEGALGDEDRRRLLADVVEQSEELTALVGDLIELARGDLPIGAAEDVRLDRIVEESVGRARRNSGSVRFALRAEPVVVEGLPERLERAVNNLLDNAARHSPPGGTVEVDVDAQGVRVRDHGRGIDEADLPQVFDRFFRGASARGTQGSGLGLAIVRQVAEQHGGSVSAANASDGGAVFTLRLPTVAIGAGEAGEAGEAGDAHGPAEPDGVHGPDESPVPAPAGQPSLWAGRGPS